MLWKSCVAGVFALGLMSTAALAQDQAVIDAITQDLIEDGFTQSVRITVRGDDYRVEAQGVAGNTDRQYRNQVLAQEATTDPLGFQVERSFDGDGNLVRERVQTADGVVERQYQAGVMVEEQLRTGGETGAGASGAAAGGSDTGAGSASGAGGADGGGAGSGGAGGNGGGRGN